MKSQAPSLYHPVVLSLPGLDGVWWTFTRAKLQIIEGLIPSHTLWLQQLLIVHPLSIPEADDPKAKEAKKRWGIEFVFNVEYTPHHGGRWEQMAKEFQRIFAKIVDSVAKMTYDALATLLVRAKGIINQRPIGIDNKLCVITPMQLLQPPSAAAFAFKMGQSVPRMNKQVRQSVKYFWKLWHTRYLTQHAAERLAKGNARFCNLAVGDKALLKDNCCMSNVFAKADWMPVRVTEIFPSSDGSRHRAPRYSVQGERRRADADDWQAGHRQREPDGPVPLAAGAADRHSRQRQRERRDAAEQQRGDPDNSGLWRLASVAAVRHKWRPCIVSTRHAIKAQRQGVGRGEEVDGTTTRTSLRCQEPQLAGRPKTLRLCSSTTTTTLESKSVELSSSIGGSVRFWCKIVKRILWWYLVM